MAVNIKSGNNGAGLANVSSTNELNVVTPQTESDAGFVQISSENDAGSVTGKRYTMSPETSDDYRLRVGMDTIQFYMTFETTNNTPNAHLTTASSTFAATQSTGYHTLNSGSSTTNGAFYNVKSWKCFNVYGSYPVYAEFWLKDVNSTFAFTISEWGFGYGGTNLTPTDGVYFRSGNGGELFGIINFNGSEVVVKTIDTTNLKGRDGVSAFSRAEVNHYVVSVGADEAEFWINDTLVATADIPSSSAYGPLCSTQPLMYRVYNTSAGTVVAGKQIAVAMVSVSTGDMHTSKPWAHTLCGLGNGAYQAPVGQASGSTVTRGTGALGWPTTAVARIAGTWTNNTAPALGSLGGLWTTPAISSLASDTDYPVFSYLNPIGTASVPGKTLYVTGVRVGEAFASINSLTNPIFMSYIVAVGSNVVGASGGVDGIAALSTRGIPIGGHGFLATDITGTTKPGFEVHFNSPLAIQPAQYFTFVARPFGTVAGNPLVFTSSLAVNGYFE